MNMNKHMWSTKHMIDVESDVSFRVTICEDVDMFAFIDLIDKNYTHQQEEDQYIITIQWQ